MNKLKTLGLLLAASAGTVMAGEKTMLHCFTFTPIETAAQSDWDAFYKATDALPGKIPAIKRVWAGKLMRPLGIVAANIDAETRKKMNAGEKVTGEISATRRQYGVCMEMENQAALKTYADHAAHKEWEAVYSKVRVPGTTTFDLIGQ